MEDTQIQDLELLAAIEHCFSALGRFDRSRRRGRGLIETERNALGISQRQMAKRMNMREQSYQRFRKRLQDKPDSIKLATIRKVAGAMGCNAVIVLIPQDEASFTDVAQGEMDFRAKRAKEQKAYCQQAGRELGGRPTSY